MQPKFVANNIPYLNTVTLFIVGQLEPYLALVLCDCTLTSVGVSEKRNEAKVI